MNTQRRPDPSHTRRRRGSKISIPEHVSPHVKLVFAEMQRLGVTYDDVEVGSGVRVPCVKAWRRKNRPSLESLEAVLGWLGWDFVPVPRPGTLPPGFDADLMALAERASVDMPNTFAALVATMAEQRMRVPTAANDDAPTRDEAAA